MTETFKKLNFKFQTPILIVSAPDTFVAEIAAMQTVTEIHPKPAKGTLYSFALAFGATKADIEKAARAIVGILEEDAVLWFAYPKLTSKKYRSDLSREIMWEVLAPHGVRPVRQIAVDDDWSALRFRKGTLTRP